MYLGEVGAMYSLVASIFPSWIPPRLRAAQAAAPGAEDEHQDQAMTQTVFKSTQHLIACIKTVAT